MTATLERPALRYRSAHQRKSARADAAGLRWVAGDLISYGPTPTDPSVRQTLRARAADTLAQIEAAIAAALIDAWGAQEQLVLGRLRGRKARAGTRHWTVPNGKPVVTKDIDPDYVLPDAGVQAVVDAVSPVIANELGPAIQGAFARITPGPTADPIGVRSSIVQDAISREIERLTGLVGADADRVRAVISNADATDKDMDAVLADVRDHYSNTPARAEMRARMVAIGGLNGGSLDVARSMGVTSKEWLSSHDEKVRETHQIADRQVQNIDDPFHVGGFDLDYPGDPSGLPATGAVVYNCRCTMLFARPPLLDASVAPWQLQAGADAVQTALDQVAKLLQGPSLGSPSDDLSDPSMMIAPRTALLSAPLVGWRTASADAIPAGVGEQFNAPLPMSLTLLRQQAAGTAVAPDLLVRVEVPGNGQVVSWDGSSAEIVVPAGAQLFVVARDDQQVTLRVVPPPGALGD